MDLNLSGKVAIVSGASKGIGKSIAQILSAEGMRLTLVARSPLDEFSASLSTDCLPLSIDMRHPDSASRVVNATLEKFGALNVLVNNAGATKRGDFLALTDEEWTDGFALKFYGAMRLSRSSWPHLMQNKGCIINIIGIGGRTGSAEFAIGGTVNAALMNLTKVLADRGIKDGVRVNAINPGSIVTARLQTRIQTYAAEQNINIDEAKIQMVEKLNVTRFGEPNEIAQAVVFLASSQAAYIQGAILDVDGGATRTL